MFFILEVVPVLNCHPAIAPSTLPSLPIHLARINNTCVLSNSGGTFVYRRDMEYTYIAIYILETSPHPSSYMPQIAMYTLQCSVTKTWYTSIVYHTNKLLNAYCLDYQVSVFHSRNILCNN